MSVVFSMSLSFVFVVCSIFNYNRNYVYIYIYICIINIIKLNRIKHKTVEKINEAYIILFQWTYQKRIYISSYKFVQIKR